MNFEVKSQSTLSAFAIIVTFGRMSLEIVN
jgi:hypothetical protein